MTDHPPSGPASTVALFRFRVVSEVLAEVMRGSARGDAVRRVSQRVHMALQGGEVTVRKRSLYRWLAHYEKGGIAALEPARRSRAETSVVLSQPLLDFLRQQKTDDPRTSIPELIKRARQLGILKPKEAVDRVTVWRAITRMGLPTRQRPSKREGDKRRFAYPHRMQMVLCDGKHFRVGKKRLRRVVLFYLDDATRFVLGAAVGTGETTALFLAGLFDVLMHHGKMDSLYLDRGPGFRSDDTWAVVSQLHVPLILGAARYPEGHGKIERFNQTALHALIRTFDGAADIDPDCRALQLRLRHFIEGYNDSPHTSLGGDTPRQRWLGDTRPLAFEPSETQLRARFIVTEERRVSNDHIIRHDSAHYEVPRGLARQRIQLRRQLLDGGLSILHDGKVVKLHPVDLAENARSKRSGVGDPRASREVEEAAPAKSAATLAFERDHGPIVHDGGGFADARRDTSDD